MATINQIPGEVKLSTADPYFNEECDEFVDVNVCQERVDVLFGVLWIVSVSLGEPKCP